MRHSQEVQAWMDRAETDLISARVLLQNEPPLLATAVFHCQQAAEKYLKAFLVDHRIKFEKVHNLVYVVDLCAEVDTCFKSLTESAALLTPYAVMTRYSGDRLQISKKEADSAYRAAETIVKVVTTALTMDRR